MKDYSKLFGGFLDWQYENELLYEDISIPNAVSIYYRKTIFSMQYSDKGLRIEKNFLFKPSSEKFYIVESAIKNQFLSRYFPSHQEIVREPIGFYLLYPVFAIGKIKIDPNWILDGNIHYDPKFCSSFINLVLLMLPLLKSDLTKCNTEYRTYLEQHQSWDSSCALEVSKLVKPVYLPSDEEKVSLSRLVEVEENKFDKVMKEYYNGSYDKDADRHFDGMIDEMNDIAYENKRDLQFDYDELSEEEPPL